MREFYTTILKPLGYALFVDVKGSHCGFKNKDDIPDVWLGRGRKNGPKKYDGDLSNRLAPIHVAFTGNDRKHVDEWHEAAAGAVDNGKPGIRKDYAPGYYVAFVLDPVGNNIEVVYMS